MQHDTLYPTVTEQPLLSIERRTIWREKRKEQSLPVDSPPTPQRQGWAGKPAPQCGSPVYLTPARPVTCSFPFCTLQGAGSEAEELRFEQSTPPQVASSILTHHTPYTSWERSNSFIKGNSLKVTKKVASQKLFYSWEFPPTFCMRFCWGILKVTCFKTLALNRGLLDGWTQIKVIKMEIS